MRVVSPRLDDRKLKNIIQNTKLSSQRILAIAIHPFCVGYPSRRCPGVKDDYTPAFVLDIKCSMLFKPTVSGVMMFVAVGLIDEDRSEALSFWSTIIGKVLAAISAPPVLYILSIGKSSLSDLLVGSISHLNTL